MRFSACWPSIYEVKNRTTLTFLTQHIGSDTTTRAQIRIFGDTHFRGRRISLPTG